jgi:hypothetical protein
MLTNKSTPNSLHRGAVDLSSSKGKKADLWSPYVVDIEPSSSTCCIPWLAYRRQLSENAESSRAPATAERMPDELRPVAPS